MTDALHQTTQDLITDYYTKDRKRSVAVLCLALAGVLTVIISAVWILQARQSLNKQQIQILSLQKEIDDRTQDIQNQITCISQYFTQRDRANIVIPNIDKCNIVRVK